VQIREEATIRDAASKMCELSTGILGVVDSKHRLKGIFTERDLAWAVGQGLIPGATLMREVTNDFFIESHPSITTEDARRRMLDGHVRHLVMRCDEGYRSISMRDLLKEELTSTR
jgi:CBS domain-containing protein